MTTTSLRCDWDGDRMAERWLPGTSGGPDGEAIALREPGRFFGDLLDPGGDEAVIVVSRTADGPTIIVLDLSPTAVSLECSYAGGNEIATVSFAVADISHYLGYAGALPPPLGDVVTPSPQGVSRFHLVIDTDTLPGAATPALDDILGAGWQVNYAHQARLHPADRTGPAASALLLGVSR